MENRIIGAGAITFGVVATVAFALVQPMPAWDAALDDVVRHHQDHLLQFRANGVLNLVSTAGLLVFFAGFGRKVGGLGGALVAGFGGLGVALILAFHAVMLATLRVLDQPDAVRVLWVLVNSGFPLTGLPLAAALFAIAATGHRELQPVVARLAAVPALVLAVLAVSAAVPVLFPLGVVGYPVLSLWLVVAGGWLVWRG